jgi:V-type H+-transporting ATPase subunit E
MSRPLNDEEVRKEMEKMVAFIQQEAEEKAHEILVKAEEEFNMEKSSLLQAGRRTIKNIYEKKEKQLETQKKIAYSNLINRNRLCLLEARETHINDLLSQAKARLEKLTQDRQRYRLLLRDLILEGLFKLLESPVVLQTLERDYSLAESLLDEISKEYEAKSSMNIKLSLDRDRPLYTSAVGGVILTALNGGVQCANTLEVRLEHLNEKALPEIRKILFGPSPNRKFFN